MDMTARLPQDKLSELQTIITSWVGKKFCTRKELESLVGKLSHACAVVDLGRTFLQRLINLLRGSNQRQKFIRLTKQARLDLLSFRSVQERPYSLVSLVAHNCYVLYHTVWYRIWVALCNTFRYVPYSLVLLVAHNLLRFIPYNLVTPMGCNSQDVSLDAMQYRLGPTVYYVIRLVPLVGRKLQYVPLDTTQSGIARWSQFARCFNMYHTVWYRLWPTGGLVR